MNKIIIVLILIVITLLSLLSYEYNKAVTIENLYSATSDTLNTFKDRSGRQIAQITAFKDNDKKQFLELVVKDTQIIALQKTVKEYKGKLHAAINFGTQTNSSGSHGTIQIKTDTVRTDTVMYVYPNYETSWENRWEKGFISANRDSINHSIQFKNEFEVTIGETSNKLFKKKSLMVQVINLNPNTYTTNARGITLHQDPKRFNLGLQFGYGVDLMTFKPVIYFGGGLSYRIVGLK